MSIYKPLSLGRTGTLKISAPGLIASTLLHASVVSAALWLSHTPPRVAGAPTVTVSLIDAVDATTKKIPKPLLKMPKQPAPLPLLEPEPVKEQKEELEDSVATLAANKQGEPTEQEPLREAQFSADYLHNPKPQYPSLSRRLGEQGRVLLHVQVSSEGLPLDVAVKESSGYARLDQAAVAVVKNWQFVPAKRGSFTLVSWVDVPLQFSLNE